MRFAVFSDIHGNRSALEAVLNTLDRSGVKDIVNLGDSLSGPFDPAGTADLLLEREVPSVRGNHDRMLLVDKEELGLWEQWTAPHLKAEHWDWLQSLPETIARGEILFTHAAPGNDSENWLDHRGADHRVVARERAGAETRAEGTQARLVLTGHTHTPRMVRLSGNRQVVNPGSVGCPAYLDTRTEPPVIHETGAADARYAIVEQRDEDFEVALCSVPYDPREMQGLARSKGAESWATAIETGWFTPAERL